MGKYTVKFSSRVAPSYRRLPRLERHAVFLQLSFAAEAASRGEQDGGLSQLRFVQTGKTLLMQGEVRLAYALLEPSHTVLLLGLRVPPTPSSAAREHDATVIRLRP